MENKMICVYHSRDLDGWMSAAIVKKWFETQQLKSDEPAGKLSFLGWDYGDEIPDLSEYGKVIMCDVSFPSEVMWKIKEKHPMNLNNPTFIWLDHHISAINEIDKKFKTPDFINGLRDTKFAACELTWKYFFTNEKMPEIVRLLGRYDCFGHKGTEEEQKVLEFQYGARMKMKNYEDCHKMLNLHPQLVSDLVQVPGYHIYKYACSEAESTYKKSFPIRFHKHITPTEAASESKFNFLCVNQERFNPINFGIDYHKEGYDGFACFWYTDGKWNFSLYSDDGNVDCSKIAKQYGGGGHAGASGFVINNLEQIIKQ